MVWSSQPGMNVALTRTTIQFEHQDEFYPSSPHQDKTSQGILRSVDDIIIFSLLALQIVLSMMSILTPDYRKKKEAEEEERGKFFRIGDRLISLFLRLLPLQIENCNYLRCILIRFFLILIDSV